MKVSIHFSLVPGKASDLPIRMRCSYDGIRLDLRTGYVCPASKWIGERMKGGSSNRYGETASDINSALSEQESLVLRILRRYELDESVPSADTLKREFNDALGRKSRKSYGGDTILDLFRSYIKSNASVSWSAGTTKTMISALSVIGTYSVASKKVSNLCIADMDEFLSELFDAGLENKTIKGYVSFLKASLRWGRTSGLYNGNIPEVYSPKLKGIGNKDVHYLEWEEFERIYNLDLSSDRDIITRDVFCLCCSTGLRVSDALALRWSNVTIDTANPHISVIAKKTNKQTIVELNKWSMSILRRRFECSSSDRVFPSVLYTYLRTHLRKISRKAGIDREVRMLSFSGNSNHETYKPIHTVITSHWGRHTFIVRALALGIAPTTIMAWTGHSSYDAMKPYIAIVDQTKRESMSRFDG